MFSPVEDEDVRRAAATCTFFLVLKAVKEEVGAKASAVLVVVAATTANARTERARRSRIILDVLALGWILCEAGGRGWGMADLAQSIMLEKQGGRSTDDDASTSSPRVHFSVQ